MTQASDTIRIVIPLAIRRRNGRPRILPPEGLSREGDRGQDPHVLRAIARAWKWRRRLEAGEAATIRDIAQAEKLSDRFVGRMMRLAYLSPDVLARLVITRDPPAVSLNDLTAAAGVPWEEQVGRVFGLVRNATAEYTRRALEPDGPDGIF